MFKTIGWIVVMSAATYGTYKFFQENRIVPRDEREREPKKPSETRAP